VQIEARNKECHSGYYEERQTQDARRLCGLQHQDVNNDHSSLIIIHLPPDHYMNDDCDAGLAAAGARGRKAQEVR